VPPDADGVSYLSRALEDAVPGDSLLLAPGLYRGVHTLESGVSIIGTAGPDSTILDADGGRYVLFGRGIDSTTVISGLTLQNGRRDHPNSGGGGIYLYGSSPLVLNNVFRNHLGYLGPGVYMNYGCRAVVAYNVFRDNEGYLGGAVAAYQDCQPLIFNNVLHDNKAVSGGGILCMNSTPVLLHNTIVANRAGHGGAIYCDSSPALIRANVMAQNDDDGAIFWLDDDAPAAIRENVVWENRGGEGGGKCPRYVGRDGNCREDPGFLDPEHRRFERTTLPTSCAPRAGARPWNPRVPPAVPDSVLAQWRAWIGDEREP
jgi:hypothetical protein